MPKIDDPRHSRPLDVHRWSEHPEVKALVAKLWEGYLPPQITGALAGEKLKTGPKPRRTSGPNLPLTKIIDAALRLPQSRP